MKLYQGYATYETGANLYFEFVDNKKELAVISDQEPYETLTLETTKEVLQEAIRQTEEKLAAAKQILATME